MSDPYFFIDPEDAARDKISIYGEDLKHLVQVLRGKPGDKINISDNKKYKYTSEIEEIKNNVAVLAIKSRRVIKDRVPKITLFQCMLKKNSMELVIQKATEIGASSIVPVISKRVVSDLPAGGKKTGSKISRWQKISDQASKQSKRDFKCQVSVPLGLPEIKVSDYGLFLVPYAQKEDAGFTSGSLTAIKQSSNIGCIIGPEGGFEEGEIEDLESRGAVTLKFGNNILRSETAAVYLLSVMDYLIREK
jgi:16S rRNA (uracil1498-N3)-methyltransferase